MQSGCVPILGDLLDRKAVYPLIESSARFRSLTPAKIALAGHQPFIWARSKHATVIDKCTTNSFCWRLVGLAEAKKSSIMTYMYSIQGKTVDAMSPQNLCDYDLTNLIDMHIHTAPDVVPRCINDLQATQEARAAGITQQEGKK